MQNISINFRGPYNLDELKKKSGNAIGIYIWGFYYKRKSDTEPELIMKKDDLSNENKIFIPYYVGLVTERTIKSGNSSGSIYQRIQNEHLNLITAEKSKYLRFIRNYMNIYFRDSSLIEQPRKRDEGFINQIESNPDIFNVELGKIAYINKIQFFTKVVQEKYSGPKDISILGKDRGKRDTLKNLITIGNFFVLYADMSSIVKKFDEEYKISIKNFIKGKNPADSQEWILKFFETYIKYTLQGKTIGQSNLSSDIIKKKDFFKIKEIDINIIDNYGIDITSNYFLKIPRDENTLNTLMDNVYGFSKL